MIQKFIISFITLLLAAFTNLLAQPSGIQYRKTAQIEGNQIKSVISNWGTFAQPNILGYHGFRWMFDKNIYLTDYSLWFGVELPIKDYNGNGSPDTIHSFTVTFVERPMSANDFGPDFNFWGFEPLDGFVNPFISDPLNSIALSNKPYTWPNYWPDNPQYGGGVWNGLFGANSFVGSQEAYFVIDDKADQRMFTNYGFLPDSTDTTRKGQGIRVSLRYVQLSNELFKDIIFLIYDIKNEGTTNYEKTLIGNLTGTYVGGEGDEWNDDVSLFYKKENMIVVSDFENRIRSSANPYWIGDVGKLGIKFISAPNANEIASFRYFVPANNVNLADDEMQWKQTQPGNFQYPASVIFTQDSIPIATRGEDGDFTFASNYFQLPSQSKRRIAEAMAFGESNEEILQKLKMAEALYHSNFDTILVVNKVQLTNLSEHQLISGNYELQWNYSNTAEKVEIWYSNNLGITWNNLTKNSINTGSYNWSSENFDDAAFGLIRIFLKDSSGYLYAFHTSKPFRVNNSKNCKPFVKILNEEIYSGTITANDYPFKILIGDVDNSTLKLNLYSSVGSDTNYYYIRQYSVATDTAPQILYVPLTLFPNSDQLIMRLELVDDSSYSFTKTKTFSKENVRQPLPSNNFILRGNADVSININICDSSFFAGNKLLITFDDTSAFNNSKTFSVFDATRNIFLIKGKPFHKNQETPMFSGITFKADDYFTQMDTIRSGWNIIRPTSLKAAMTRYDDPGRNIKGFPEGKDYKFVFSNVYQDSSHNLSSILKTNVPSKTNINFKIYEVSNSGDRLIKFGFVEPLFYRKDTLSRNDIVVLADQIPSYISWRLFFTGDSSSYVPQGGDTLYIFTKKGLSYLDTIEIFGLPPGINEVDEATIGNFKLYQNFPNPFNPSTKIKFSIPRSTVYQSSQKVTLKVYDILGCEVATLVNEELPAGEHEVEFTAPALASSIYFYQFHFGSFIETKKMLLLK